MVLKKSYKIRVIQKKLLIPEAVEAHRDDHPVEGHHKQAEAKESNPYWSTEKEDNMTCKQLLNKSFLPQGKFSLSTSICSTLLHNDPAVHQAHCGR